MYGKPDVPKASPEIAAQAYSELADLQKEGNWDAAVELVAKAGDPSVRSLPENDWYRLRRKLEIIKVIFDNTLPVFSSQTPSAFHSVRVCYLFPIFNC